VRRGRLRFVPCYSQFGFPFKVVRTNGGDVVLARASNTPIQAAFETANPIEPANAHGSSARRHVLPKDLPGAIKQLDDQELDRLLAAVLAEQKRRHRKLAESVEPPGKVEAPTVYLAPGKLNAVRAAFKAGVKPSQIARQFDLSQSDVRKALAGR
jgi:hypothetical protein